MIIDKIENAHLYYNLHERLKLGLEYLQKADMNTLEPGKYEICGEDVFVLVQAYHTKPAIDCNVESHFKYADIQYVISGSEQIGVATLTNQETTVVDRENDYCLYDCETTLIPIEAGIFAIFFPDDVHKPSVQNGQSKSVKKAVVKINLETSHSQNS